METINLSDELAQETQVVDEVDPSTLNGGPSEPASSAPPAEETPAPKKKVEIDPETSADLLIGALDMVQSSGLTFVKRRKTFAVDEWRRLRQLAWRKRAHGEITTDDADQMLMAREEEFREVVDDFPFTDKEHERLMKPMTAMLEEKNVKVSPVFALIIAVIVIMVPRIIATFFEDVKVEGRG